MLYKTQLLIPEFSGLSSSDVETSNFRTQNTCEYPMKAGIKAQKKKSKT